jgi:hypothetical protein
MMTRSHGVQVTMLNSMAGADFGEAIARQKAWGVGLLDLKDSIFGKGIMDLTDEEADRAAGMARAGGQEVYCLSTGLFYDAVERGEEHFRAQHLARVARAVELARILRPRFIRLLAATTRRRAEVTDAIAYLREEHPWVFELYGEAVTRVTEAGFEATIENEVGGCILSRPEEVTGLFAELGHPEGACLTWDVQNLWQMGAFPSVEAYEDLRPLIGYLHLKGGIAGPGGTALKWRSALEDASWPVADILRAAVRDRVSPVICLNSSHGEPKPGYDYGGVVERDLRYTRRIIEGTER